MDLRVDSVATIRAAVCPHCAVPLDWVERRHLTSVSVRWRCMPGRKPVSCKLFCERCTQLLLVHISPDRLFFNRDAAGCLRAEATYRREQEMELLEERFLRD